MRGGLTYQDLNSCVVLYLCLHVGNGFRVTEPVHSHVGAIGSEGLDDGQADACKRQHARAALSGTPSLLWLRITLSGRDATTACSCWW